MDALRSIEYDTETGVTTRRDMRGKIMTPEFTKQFENMDAFLDWLRLHASLWILQDSDLGMDKGL